MKARSGVALVLAIVVLLFIEAMAAGLIALTLQGRLIAASDMRSTRARAAAELAVKSILRDWEDARFDTIASGRIHARLERAAGDAAWLGSVERAGGTFLVRGSALVGGNGAFSTAKAWAVVRMMDRRAVLEGFNAAIISEGLVVLAGHTRLMADADSCPIDSLGQPSALLARGEPVIASDVSVRGSVSSDSTLATPDSMALGGVRWSELAGIADRTEAGAVTPQPAVLQDRCDLAAAANWGDPDDATPCVVYFPLIYAAADLTINGGRGQGLLAVQGTLTLTGGARFAGVVIARDGVLIEPGSAVVGSVRSQGITLVDGGEMTYTRCAVVRAIDGTRAVRRAILQRRTFIPAF